MAPPAPPVGAAAFLWIVAGAPSAPGNSSRRALDSYSYTYDDYLRRAATPSPPHPPAPPSPPPQPPQPPLQPGALLVSTVNQLTAAVADASVPHIVIAPGTYTFTSSMCPDSSGLCIGRDVTIEAAVAGTVVLDAQGTYASPRRVIYINGGATKLINLVITGGFHVRGSRRPYLSRARRTPMMLLAYAAPD